MLKSQCECKTESVNGHSATVCKQDGEVVAECKNDAGEVVGTTEGELPAPTAPPVSTECECETKLTDGALKTTCKKGGKEIPESEYEAAGCDTSAGVDNLNLGNGDNSGQKLEDLMEGLKTDM